VVNGKLTVKRLCKRDGHLMLVTATINHFTSQNPRILRSGESCPPTPTNMDAIHLCACDMFVSPFHDIWIFCMMYGVVYRIDKQGNPLQCRGSCNEYTLWLPRSFVQSPRYANLSLGTLA
jgi:hypothetical protein